MNDPATAATARDHGPLDIGVNVTSITRDDLSRIVDREDPRFHWFVRLAARFTYTNHAELTVAELEALWEAAERSRKIELRLERLDSLKSLRRNFNVAESVVYYFKVGQSVKIGTSTNVTARMTTLCLRPDDLAGLEAGDHELEFTRHRQFAEYRATGEWFHLAPPIQAHLDTLPQEWREVAKTAVFVTVGVAARAVGVDHTTLYRWVEKGLLAKYGDKVDQYEVEELAESMKSRSSRRAGLAF